MRSSGSSDRPRTAMLARQSLALVAFGLACTNSARAPEPAGAAPGEGAGVKPWTPSAATLSKADAGGEDADAGGLVPTDAASTTTSGAPSARASGLAGGGPRSVSGEFGIVTSAEANATRAGVGMLEAGGNAMDAAVATAAALAVTHPSAGNLGGGGFLLVRPFGGVTSAIDFRENAPSSLTRPEFDRMIAKKGSGPVAIGVPGSVAGLLLAHRRFGKLSREAVLAPALALARDGHVLGPQPAKLIARSWQALRADPAARKIFGTARGTPLPSGARLVQTDLAGTLERVAALGEAGFYAGETARAIASASGGRISTADLAAYRALLREPIRGRYRGFELETMPPPSAGGPVLAGMLAALETLEPTAAPSEGLGELHRFVEVAKRAQALRRFSVVDPDTRAPAELAQLLRRFLTPANLLEVPIDEGHATPAARVNPLFDQVLKEAEHTTHVSVVDRDGMVVALTTTLSASFGSRIVAPGTGVVLGNAVASFSSVGDNQPRAGQRTTSSMAPTLVLRSGVPVLVLGTPGGDTIPSTLALLVRRLIDQRLPLDGAIDAPRIHHGFVPDEVRFEPARPLSAELLRGLRGLGHRVRPARGAQGDANCLLLEGRRAFAYSDPREDGGLALAARPPDAPLP